MGQNGYDYQAISESLRNRSSMYSASQVNMSTACDTILPYSSGTVRTLYDIFNGHIELPCHGQHLEERFSFSRDYTVALGLAEIENNPGNQTHQSFGTVIAKAQRYRWTRIQFQVPTSGYDYVDVQRTTAYNDVSQEKKTRHFNKKYTGCWT
jgi:hypothetical protein